MMHWLKNKTGLEKFSDVIKRLEEIKLRTPKKEKKPLLPRRIGTQGTAEVSR